MFICKKCGKADPPRRGNRRKCLYCERDYIKEWKKARPERQKTYNKGITQKRLRAKQLCVEYLGGKCQMKPECLHPLKEDKEPCLMVMQFHHRDPEQKDMEISRRMRVKGLSKLTSIDSLKEYAPELVEELDKCDLLCANCHAYVEYCSSCKRKSLSDAE